jgi:Tfp pilus assembly protein PilN
MSLLTQPASARQYDMLPAFYRRPDYMKKALLALAVANLILVLLLGCGKGWALYRQGEALDQQIAASQAEATEALKIKTRINKLKKELDDYRAMGSNIDLITFMATLSAHLPDTTYLDQLRFDEATRTITLQGYTDDLPSLTTKIPDLGAATLKSTMKRRNQTYFHMEVSIP